MKLAKQQKTQQFCMKLNSSFLAKYNWDLTLPVEEARKTPGVIISLADSQILTWINELNGTEDFDDKAKAIKKEIKQIKKEKSSKENKKRIKDLYSNLYKIQFKEDYLCLIIDKLSDYDRANKGFKVNGVEYRRLLTTTNGVKTSTVVYTSVRLVDELKKRIENGRNTQVKMVPAKLGAYEALCSSASIPVSWPKGIIVVKDCITKFKSDLINIDDSDTTREPIVEFAPMQEVVNNASDGCSMMLPSLSMRWNGELGGDPNHTISGCNLRCAWTKGMTFTFDYLEWAEKNVGSYIIKDVWGHDRDLRESELILTESQLKLWSQYDSWEDYYNKCLDNHYTIRVAKTAPHEVDDVRQLNYQFEQIHDANDADVQELISDTMNEIKDIMRFDYRKSIVYLCGSGLDENNIQSMDLAAQALMINRNMIDDPYIFSRIKNMIQKRIRDAKIGVIDVHGNFQIISGDLVALCESMFGIEPKGVLKAGEIYSKFWSDFGAKQVVCYRAPMSNAHSVLTQNISYSDEAAYWFRYIDTCVVVNAWDTMPAALNGFDFDGDLLFTTDNPVLLRTHENLPALNCIQYNATKKVVTEEDVIASNKLGFGSKIGQITNRITCMTSLMANYEPGSHEYEILRYRTQCGQAQQQAEIDKAKGILPNPMPKSWYDLASIKIDYENDTKEDIELKTLYKKICAHKKPYFFSYNYLSMKTEYDKYMENVELKSCSMFKMSFKDLLLKDNRTEDEAKFIKWAQDKIPLDMSASLMNRICWAIESEMGELYSTPRENFDFSMIKSGYNYSNLTFKAIENEYHRYKKQVSNFTKKKKSEFYIDEDTADDEGYDDVNQFREQFAEKCAEICPNEYELCDIMVDLCYKCRNNKEIVWLVCGETIIKNLLKKNNFNMYFPQKVASEEEFWCKGSRFSMKKVKIGGENE